MWIVALALRRPLTFIVMAIGIVILMVATVLRTPTDIFPAINIPVVSVIWFYNGLSPEDMAERIVANSERSITTTVNDIEHLESQSVAGLGIIKVFFRPGTNVEGAIAQITSIAQTSTRSMPAGTTPPLIISYNASTTPVIQLGLSSRTLSEQELFDLGQNFLRTYLVTVPGAATPYPYGGKVRQIQVDLDLEQLRAHGLQPLDIVNAVNAQNLVLPTGTVKLGPLEYNLEMNGTPSTIAGLNDLPVKTGGGATLYLRDVAHVRDGFAPQTNIVRANGARGALMSIYKHGNGSTLSIVAGVKDMVARAVQALPPALTVNALFDQSLFVRASIQGVLREAITAAFLTALMILLFLGDWRPTVVIAISIPLSIFVSIILLGALGETLNIMTLGGLALAVGILVDDATVEIENIERNLAMGKEMKHAILDGAAADRRARLRLHPVHLHRVRAHVLPQRRGAVPVRAPGRGGVLRHAGQLLPVPDPDPYPGGVHHARPRAPARCRQDRPGPLPARVRAALRELPPRLRAPAGDHPGAPGRLRGLVPGLLRRCPWA